MPGLPPQPPEVSIVLVVGPHRERAAQCLASVLAQPDIDRAEVLILDLAAADIPPVTGSEHPSVRLQRVENPEPLSVLRIQGARAARAEFIAYVEDHTVVVPGWLRAVRDGLRQGHGGVGGEPGTLNPGSGISDAITLMNYGFFRPAPAPRTSSMLPGHNSAYPRALLLSFGDLLRPLIMNEVLLNRKIIERGYTLWLDPAAKFLHFNEETLGMILGGYYYWNVCFGHNRALVNRWPWWRRLAQVLAAPLVPPVRYVKHMLHAWRNDRPSVRLLLRYTGVFLCAQSAAAFGMAVGVLFGLGDAERRFQNYEIYFDRSAKAARG